MKPEKISKLMKKTTFDTKTKSRNNSRKLKTDQNQAGKTTQPSHSHGTYTLKW